MHKERSGQRRHLRRERCYPRTIQKGIGGSGTLDGFGTGGDKLRIPGVADGPDRAGPGSSLTVCQEELMAMDKTTACGEETNPTTNRGCEEGLVISPVPVENPFGSF